MEDWLITGAGGFIGSRLLEDLQRDRPDGVGAVVALRRAELDLTDGSALAGLFSSKRFTGVVHLAASLQRSSTPAAERQQWRDTFEAGRNIIEQSVAHNMRRLIMAGTIEELGNQDGCLGLDLEARPHTPYSLCKTLLREYAEYTCRRTSIRIDWFRPFIVYGPGQRGDMLIPTAFRAAAFGQQSDFTDGLQQRDFLFIDDLVRWIRLAMGLSQSADGFHLHHVGTGVPTRVRDVLSMIREEFPAARFHVGVRQRGPGEPDTQVAPAVASSKPALADWQAEVGLREGLRRTAEWWRREARTT